MIDFSRAKQVFLATYRVDFRKSFDGLLAEAYKMGLDPIDGDVVMFISRCRRKLRVIYCDHNGIWVLAKRFHSGGFRHRFKFLDDPSQVTITPAELQMLTSGIEFKVDHKIPGWRKTS